MSLTFKVFHANPKAFLLDEINGKLSAQVRHFITQDRAIIESACKRGVNRGM